MPTIAYVSDEMYVALSDVVAEFEPVAGGAATILQSSPRGALRGDLPAGIYRVTLAKSGYVRPDFAIQQIEAAGFKLVAASEANANPKDTKDYPVGVWALPPTYRLKDVDRAKYQAIGESDRFTLKFMKPEK